MADVKVYSTPTCPWCTKAKEFLTQNNVSFEDIDIATDQAKAMEMVAKSGRMGVPQIEIDGKMIIGFNQPEIINTLNLGS